MMGEFLKKPVSITVHDMEAEAFDRMNLTFTTFVALTSANKPRQLRVDYDTLIRKLITSTIL